MWIVRVALERPYTFIVLGLLILILSPVVVSRMPTDIFPVIDIPVIAAAWQYAGMKDRQRDDGGNWLRQNSRTIGTTA